MVLRVRGRRAQGLRVRGRRAQGLRVRADSTQSSKGNSIGQQASASSQSTQILPINVDVAPSLFSVGSNDGSVTQGNVSSANANAQNNELVKPDQPGWSGHGGLLG